MDSITAKLTKKGIHERLQACLKMEIKCADVYHTLTSLFPSSLFPKASTLFQTLAEQEERHADIIAVSIQFNEIDEAPDMIVPDNMSLIHETIEIAENIKKRIDAEKVNLKVALSLTLSMEESTAESYLQDVMRTSTDSEVISYLKKFYNDEETHAEMIKEFMLDEGIAHVPEA